MMDLKRSLGVLALLLVSGCASTPPPAPLMATVSLSTEGCLAAPLLTDAISLTPTKKQAFQVVSTLVDASKPCLTENAETSRYVVYQLPDSSDNHTVTVGGRQEEIRTFAPMIRLLDNDGKVTRQFDEDRLAIFGNILGVQFRPQAKERYILVLSNPKLVGKEIKTFETRLSATQGYAFNPATGYGNSYQTLHGVENKASRVYSHEGFVDVTVQAIKGKIGLPNEK
ncbi:MAG: hypothetical protein ACK41P_07920 [Asticcacaulis sp.]